MAFEELPKMSCSSGRRRAGEKLHTGRGGTSRGLLFSLFLTQIFFMSLSLTLADEITHVNNTKVALVRIMEDPEMSMCLKLLEAPRNALLLFRVEVKPIGPGSDMIHIGGNVKVPLELMPVGSGWSQLRYKFTSIDNELFLKVWLNDAVLPYKATQSMYSGRFEIKTVKMYMMGRMDMLDGDKCPQSPSSDANVTDEPVQAEPIANQDSNEQVEVKSVTEAHPQPPKLNTDEQLHPRPITKAPPQPPVAYPPRNPVNPAITGAATSGKDTNWVYAMGAAGSMPVLVIVVAVVVMVVLVTILSVVLWRRRSAKREANDSSKKNLGPFSAASEPLMHQAQTLSKEEAATPQMSKFSTSDMTCNPMYKPPPTAMTRAPTSPGNFYSN